MKSSGIRRTINGPLDIRCGDGCDSVLHHVLTKGAAMNPEMVVIRESTVTYPDGTTVTVTVSTADGSPLSPEDLAAINRMVPLAAGSMIDEL